MTTDNTPAMDAFLTALANLLAPKLEERMREIARDVFIDGVQSHLLCDQDDVDTRIKEALEEHTGEETHYDEDRLTEAVNEALAEAFRGIARSL